MDSFRGKMLGGKRHGNIKEVELEAVEEGKYLHKLEGAKKDVQKMRVHVRFKDNTHEVPQGMVRKRFKDAGEFENAVEAYYACKNLGLRVVPTFRADEETKSILMTNLNRSYLEKEGGEKRERIALSYANDLYDETPEGEKIIKGPFISRFAKFPDFVDTFLSYAIRVSEIGVRLSGDSYLFLVDKREKESNIDFVIGDFENVRVYEPGENVPEDLIKENILSAKDALRSILVKYVKTEPREGSNDTRAEYLSLLDEKVELLRRNLDASNVKN